MKILDTFPPELEYLSTLNTFPELDDDPAQKLVRMKQMRFIKMISIRFPHFGTLFLSIYELLLGK